MSRTASAGSATAGSDSTVHVGPLRECSAVVIFLANLPNLLGSFWPYMDPLRGDDLGCRMPRRSRLAFMTSFSRRRGIRGSFRVMGYTVAVYWIFRGKVHDSWR